MKQLKQISNLQKFISNLIKKKKTIFFFFDYDGVLVKIRNNPSKSYLPTKIKKTLLKLSKLPHIKVAIVSGRNLDTLNKLTKIKNNITLIGSHGLEFFYKSKRWLLFKKDIKLIKKIKQDGLTLAKATANGFLEHKPYTFTYHIRDKRKINLVKKVSKVMNAFLKKNTLHKKLKVLEGKKIIEILPREVNKGIAVEKIIKLFPSYKYLYFGDDITDIPALKTVKRYGGIAISLNQKLNYKADFLTDYNSFQKNIINYLAKLAYCNELN